MSGIFYDFTISRLILLLSIHRKKMPSSSSSPNSSSPHSTLKKSRSKSYLVKAHFGEALSDEDLPEFIVKAMDYLLQYATNIEGLFRISGHAGSIAELKKKLNSGKAIDLEDVENVHNLAGLVKLYFRELPNPLICFECYDMFMIADSIPDQDARLECLKKLLVYLPPTNQL